MGELIHLPSRSAQSHAGRTSRAPRFAFDVACPLSYLAAENIERRLGPVRWTVLSLRMLTPIDVESVRRHAEANARLLRLPLVWPDRPVGDAPRALRAASRACELGAGGRFSLALMRLAFCGGFDIEDPEILAEAAAAADIPLDECLAAAADPARDARLAGAARRLREQGVTGLPAVRVGRRWFEGERGLVAATALLRRGTDRWRPLVPVG